MILSASAKKAMDNPFEIILTIINFPKLLNGEKSCYQKFFSVENKLYLEHER